MKKSTARSSSVLVLAVALGLLAGCVRLPTENPQLTALREQYEESADSLRALAPAAVVEARDALEAAEDAWAEREPEEIVEHRALMARQHLRLAEERAALQATEDSVREERTVRYRAFLGLEAARAEAERLAAERAANEPEEIAEAPPEPAPSAPPPPETEELGAVMTRRGLVLTLGSETFADGETTLRSETAPQLAALVRFLGEYPERRVRVEGFADGIGTLEERVAFAQRRADAVKAALTERGVDAQRISTLGSTFSPERGPDGEIPRPRVEIIISDPRGVIPERDS